MTTISARVIEDSVATHGKRITTFLLKYPRFIHSEIMTHRALSRNASSSRAIPVEKVIKAVIDDPAVPLHWGKNEPGMQASEEIENKEAAQLIWLKARDEAVKKAYELVGLGVHKQNVNRILEPFSHISVVVTATELQNFFSLRLHEAAEPHFQKLAREMAKAYLRSTPKVLPIGFWHLPFVTEEERQYLPIDTQIKISVARCARVSYLLHDGTKSTIEKDLDLYTKLVGSVPLHASPAEHQATPYTMSCIKSANLVGFEQFRKRLLGENVLEFPWETEQDLLGELLAEEYAA